MWVLFNDTLRSIHESGIVYNSIHISTWILPKYRLALNLPAFLSVTLPKEVAFIAQEAAALSNRLKNKPHEELETRSKELHLMLTKPEGQLKAHESREIHIELVAIHLVFAARDVERMLPF